MFLLFIILKCRYYMNKSVGIKNKLQIGIQNLIAIPPFLYSEW